MKSKSKLRELLHFLRLVLRKPHIELDVLPESDYHHELRPGDYEAFHFLFTSADGYITGGVRTLFGPDDVLEMLAVKMGEQRWLQQRRVPLTQARDKADASGDTLRLVCVTPWERWHARFEGTPNSLSDTPQLILDLTFNATIAPAQLQMGDYTQVQQDGRFTGRIQTGADVWDGELIAYRDHSWGQRGAGNAPGWLIVVIPENLYAFIIGDTQRTLLSMGRWVTETGDLRTTVAPQVRKTAEGWCISDPKAGVAPWTFTRLGPAGVSYLGQAGAEAARPDPQPGDLYKDEIGPALFTSATGKTVVGFWDEATRIKND